MKIGRDTAVKFCFSIRLKVVGNITNQAEGVARLIRKLNMELGLELDGNVFPGLFIDRGEVLFEGRIRADRRRRKRVPFKVWGKGWIAQMRRLREALQEADDNIGRITITYHEVIEVL